MTKHWGWTFSIFLRGEHSISVDQDQNNITTIRFDNIIVDMKQVASPSYSFYFTKLGKNFHLTRLGDDFQLAIDGIIVNPSIRLNSPTLNQQELKHPEGRDTSFVIIIGIISSLLSIFTFITGISSIPSILNTETTNRTFLTLMIVFTAVAIISISQVVKNNLKSSSKRTTKSINTSNPAFQKVSVTAINQSSVKNNEISTDESTLHKENLPESIGDWFLFLAFGFGISALGFMAGYGSILYTSEMSIISGPIRNLVIYSLFGFIMAVMQIVLLVGTVSPNDNMSYFFVASPIFWGIMGQFFLPPLPYTSQEVTDMLIINPLTPILLISMGLLFVVVFGYVIRQIKNTKQTQNNP